MSRERELLERAYSVRGELSYAILKDSGEYNIAGDIYEYLAEPTIGAVLPNGAVVTNVYESYEEGLKEHAPRPEFVRLSEEEVNNLLDWCGVGRDWNYQLICAVENRLVEKNRG